MRYRVWSLAGLLCVLPTASVAQEQVTYGYDALGRLVTISNPSGPNSGTDVTTTYDPAGNRSAYRVTTATAVNRPPVANSDTAVVTCRSTAVANVLANDSDPDGDVLMVASVTRISGTSTASVSSGGANISLTGGRISGETSLFDYVVRDARGATATGRLTVQSIGSPSVQCQ